MAGIELRNGRYNIILRFGGKRIVRSLKTTDEDEALGKKLRVEENVRLIESGRLVIPDDADLMTFLLSDGKLNQKPILKASLSINQLFKAFWDALPEGTLESLSIDTMKIHQRHVERLLGQKKIVQELSQSDIQGYITKRSKEKSCHGTSIDGGTIRKEIVTFGSVWRWGVNENRIHGDFPRTNLRFPKSSEVPVFQTWQEIKRQIAAGAPEKLWDALYLDLAQVEQLLTFVKTNSDNGFVYPMFAFAAYTGARRSELLRSKVSDIDLDGGIATIREKKRVKGKGSTRRVPISKPLERVLRPWLDEHPGTPFTFFHAKLADKTDDPITKDQASYHFKHLLKDSKWSVVKGWHCLRHSFISNCASKGIDQRMIDEWVGHTTEVMRRRYRHLFPSSQKSAMNQLFK